ncbi:MAG TPA: hypothetical protein VHB50_16665 [Bryobacteraceae bacterium]|nr:hypothetical protein [Bryobacteraceae bacterium]
MHKGEPVVIPFPESGTQQAAVREQLDRILSSPLFRNSKRYPNLLRYVVEQTLDGHAGDLKERTLGIEVFGRSPDYDTNLDPVVRISAAEIRKRIAQYYHEAGHEEEVRIDLPLGSYVPEFRFPAEKQTPAADEAPAPTPIAVVPATTAAGPAARFRLQAALIPAVVAITVVASLLWFKPWVRQTAIDQFWGPVLQRSHSVLLCIGRVHDPDGKPHGVALSDATTMARLTGLLQSRGHAFVIRAEDQATFGDLRQGPFVLIGAFNDSWSLRFASGSSMRYSFHQQGPIDWIQDERDPAGRRWSVTAQPDGSTNQDFALISRINDPNTDRIMVVVGGLWGYGTLAAGEFLTNEKYMESFASEAPAGWSKKNLQIVLSTEVIRGHSGPPHVVATYFW